MDINDDLMIVRTILHINMSICLLIAQFVFLFGISQIKYKVTTDPFKYFFLFIWFI